MKHEEKHYRRFSEELKRDLVKSIDLGKLTVREVGKLYDVSCPAVYKWLGKYSKHYRRQTRLVMEKKSASHKLKKQEDRIKELEAALGRKQMRIDYLEKLIEIADKDLGIDIEKKGVRPPLNGSGGTEHNTPGQ